MDKSIVFGVGSVMALSVLAASAVSCFTIEARALLPVPFDLKRSMDRADVTLADGRALSMHDSALFLSGTRVPLSLQRRFASLTVMPTGQVLVWGGIDDEGRLIESGEWFEPATGALVTTGRLGLPARAAHTLNVLSDGTLVMTGGWGAGNLPAHDVAVWRPLNRHLDLVAGDLKHVRMKADASLLADGTLQVSGGVDQIGRAVYDTWRFGHAEPVVGARGSVVASYPAKDKLGASPIGPLSLRFRDPVNVAKLAGSISLLGPNGVVRTRVVGAEGGRLAFLQLPDELYPAARYTIFVQGLMTAKGNAVPYEAIGFTTRAARSGVVLAGEGQRPGTKAPDTSEPPVFVMAGEGSAVPCKAVDAFHLCRDRGVVKDGAFFPGQDNVATSSGGHWRLYKDRQSLPDTRDLESNLPKGATALIGQVRRIDETPVANVEVSVDGQTVHTNAQGVFVLPHLLAGRRELFVDGRPAGSPGVEYGRFIVGADVTASAVNHMPFVMYLPRVLERDKIALPSPTTRETVLTHPDMPGLELRIPAGAVFKDRDGKVLNEIAIVPTPVDHAPFPLPDNFPMYFTIQPGDAVVQGMTPDAAKGIQVVYPNYGKQKPADKADFWVYSAEKGWEMYGAGHVSADASKLVADRDTRLVWALGAGASTNPPQDNNGKKPGNKCAGDPVDLQSGLFIRHWTDLSINDVMPISVERTANNLVNLNSRFGLGTNSPMSMTLSSGDGFETPTLVLPCGEEIRFHVVSGQPVWPLIGTVWKHDETRSEYYGATLQFLNDTTPEGAHWVLTLRDGGQYWFDRHAPNNLYRRMDRYGNTVQYRYESGFLTQIVSPNGRTIGLTYTKNNVIGTVFDQLGRTIHYQYHEIGGSQSAYDGWVLDKVTFPDGTTEEYNHKKVRNGDVDIETWLVESIRDRGGRMQVTNHFESDVSPVVVGQTYADGSSIKIDYERGGSDNSISAAVVTDQNGNKERTEFDAASRYPSAVIRGYGSDKAQSRTFERDSAGLVLSETDNVGRKTTYSYDGVGNRVAMTRLAGTASAVSTTYSYTPENRISSSTDPLGHTVTMEYESSCLTALTDAMGHRRSLTCDSQGNLSSMSDPLGHSVRYHYVGGDLVSIKDPSGRTITFVTDAVGRRLATTFPDGSVAAVAYDANDNVVSVIDKTAAVSRLTYDPAGNLSDIELPNKSHLTYGYDAMDRLTSWQDASGRSMAWSYTPKGSTASVTDRRGQLTTVSYDELDRPVLRTFADGSGIQTSYGVNGQPSEVLDSDGSYIAWQYDVYDRRIKETTPGGNVSYVYDAASRRVQMTPDRQASVYYTYDEANRLISLTQSDRSIKFEYDAAGRRTNLSLPNGILASYSYDAANNLVDSSYVGPAGLVVAHDSYEYSATGSMVSRASANISQFLPAASNGDTAYDAANRIDHVDETAYSYDANGNLISDGHKDYLWNARGELASVRENDIEELAFKYDALGRRVFKTGTAAKEYLYDGINEVEENVDGVHIPILTGLKDDERFSRGADGSEQYFIVDGLGSSIALTDRQANVTRRYAYDAYGNVDYLGGASENRYLFAGREADDGNLLFYRSRYYRPSDGRFISEDSFGLSSGQANFYQYVASNPLGSSDPTGHCPWCVGAIVGGIAGGIAGYISGGAKGALAGAAVGALTGAFVPLALGQTVTAATAALGFGSGAVTGVASSSIAGALGGVGGTVLGNSISGQPIFKGAGYAAASGALAPLASGEAFLVGAGGVEALGMTAVGENVFGGMTGVVGIFGSLFDPGAEHGFTSHRGDASCDPLADSPIPQPNYTFPWPSMGW